MNAKARKALMLGVLADLKAALPATSDEIDRYITKVEAIPVDNDPAPIKLWIDLPHWAAQVGLLEADLAAAAQATPDPQESAVEPEPVARLGYRPAEFAAAIGVTRQHVHNLIRRGHIRAIKLGNATIIPASEVARLLGDAPDAP